MRSQLTWLVVALAAVAFALIAIGATPTLPDRAPDAAGVITTLRGSELPAEAIGYVLVDAAWLVWAWLVLSLCLRIVVDLGGASARGAEWVRSLRGFSDAITLPVVRRAVDGALAAVLVANVALRAVPAAAAEPLAAPPEAIVTTVQSPAANVVPDSQRQPTQTVHVVKRGETLWSIAESYYGSGREYPRLVEANLGQSMGAGRVFSSAGVIEPGWSLRVPLPSNTIENVDGTYWYTVQRGDTLWGISGRLLGDETRWPELFDANREAQMEDGHVLRDPDLIWPNLRLQLPPPLAVELDGADPDALAEPSAPTPPAPVSQPPAQSAPVPVQTTSVPEAQQLHGAAMAVGGSAAMAMLAAGALVVGRRRGRRDLFELPLNTDPQTDTPIRGGFAEVDPGRDLAQDAAPHAALILASHVQRGLADNAARVVLVKYGRSRSSVVVQAPAEAHAAVRKASSQLAARLGTAVQAHTSADGDVVFEIASQGAQGVALDGAVLGLLPVCALTDRRELWLDLEPTGHVLVASLPGGGADPALSGLLLELAARRSGGELKVWTIAAPNELPAVLDGLPQHVKARADGRSALQVEAALRDVRAELIRRMQRPVEESADDPEIALVIGELASLDYAAQRTTLDMLGAYASAHRVRIIAATRDSSRVADEVLAMFKTRLILRTASSDESRRLLGQPQAADLLGGGQLWARLGAREPVEGYALRVRPDLMERCVRLLRSQHGLPPLQVVGTNEPEAPPPPKLIELDAVDPIPGEVGNLIQVRCFGGFEVRGPVGEVIPSVEELASGGPWDVLARLAAAPEGTLSLQQLFEDVWPGTARGEAEDGLRSALGNLHGLLARGAPGLQTDVVRFAPDDTCHLDTRLVISDVHRFLRLCRAAPQMPADQARLGWQRARGLYRGALLDGPGARTWEWATSANAEAGGLSLRDQYREHAYHATRGLARLAVAEGRLEDAVLFCRELLRAEPTLEDVVRELCECYLQLGDYSAVREEEARLSRALHAAYLEAGAGEDPLAYEPDPATLALFERAHVERTAPAAAAVVAD